jgi:hypothetical protein
MARYSKPPASSPISCGRQPACLCPKKNAAHDHYHSNTPSILSMNLGTYQNRRLNLPEKDLASFDPRLNTWDQRLAHRCVMIVPLTSATLLSKRFGRGYCAVQPPSMRIAVPVMKPACGSAPLPRHRPERLAPCRPHSPPLLHSD